MSGIVRDGHFHQDAVSSGWNDYAPAEVESHPAEVHYDVLRRSGFSADRAREIARASASDQGRLLEEHRGERPSTRGISGTGPRARRAARRAAIEPSGFDIRDHLAGCRSDDEGGTR